MSERTRRRWWLDGLILVGLILAVDGAQAWRHGQLDRHGLSVTYFSGRDFFGSVTGRAIERFVDYDFLASPHAASAGSIEWRGTIVLPRSGKFTFGTISRGFSSVSIDGRAVLTNVGNKTDKAVYGSQKHHAGPHRFVVRYRPPDAQAQSGEYGLPPTAPLLRLVWTPARRWGGDEALSPTLLFPFDADPSLVARAHATPPRDFAALMMMGLALAVALLLWSRRSITSWLTALRRDASARVDALATIALILGALTVRLWDLSGAGQTWDEDVYWTAARRFVDNLLIGDLRADSWAVNAEHPAVAKWIYGPATLLSESLDAARGTAALLGAMTCGLLYLVGRDLFGRRVGLIAAACCAVMPHVLAHSKVAGLETPSGLLYLLTVWSFARGLRKPEIGGAAFTVAAVCGGLAVGTRLVNAGVFAVLLVLLIVAQREAIRRDRRVVLTLPQALLPFIAVAVFTAVWPYLWSHPVEHLARMLSHWKEDPYVETFLGVARRGPPHYFPVYFAVTMPVGAAVAFVAGLVGLALRRNTAALTLTVWLLGPFLVALSPLARDGVRYLYPALIPACLVIAIGVDGLGRLVARAARRPTVAAPVVGALATGLLLYILHAGLSVHPYYLDYYNEAVGGPAEVHKRRWFEVGWWGEGLEEANRFLTKVARPNATVYILAHPSHVIALRDDLVALRSFEADYVIYNRQFTPPMTSARHRPIYAVQAGGAPLVWVLEKPPSNRRPKE